MQQIAKSKWLVGEERARFGREAVKLYRRGASIRDLAAQTGRSYGFIVTVLTEHGADLRPRGGARSSAPKT